VTIEAFQKTVGFFGSLLVNPDSYRVPEAFFCLQAYAQIEPSFSAVNNSVFANETQSWEKIKVWTYILQADGTFMVYSVTI